MNSPHQHHTKIVFVLGLTFASQVLGRCHETLTTDKVQHGLSRVHGHKSPKAVGRRLGSQTLTSVYAVGGLPRRRP